MTKMMVVSDPSIRHLQGIPVVADQFITRSDVRCTLRRSVIVFCCETDAVSCLERTARPRREGPARPPSACMEDRAR